MGKKGKDKKKIKGAEKTAMKTEKKIINKQKKQLAALGEDDIETIIAQIEKEEAKRLEVTETIAPPPSPRVNFSIVALPDKDEILIFGGEYFNGQKTMVYNDMYVYNVNSSEWKLVKVPGGPPPRCGHQMVSIASDGGQLWLFGGEYASPTQSQFYHYRDLWVYRISTKRWEKINRSGAPSARSGHRMLAHKKKLFIFGGFHDNLRDYKYFNDLHIFSLEDYVWTKVEPGGIGPSPRSGSCFVVGSQDRLIVWGGYSKTVIKKGVDKGTTHTDMFALCADKHSTNANAYKWVSIKPGGIRPGPRSGMSACTSATGNLRAYIFGGVTDVEETEDELQGSFNDDLLHLDLENIFWNKVQLSGNKEIKKSESLENTQAPQQDTNLDNIETAVQQTTVSTDGVFKMVIGGSVSSTSSSATKSTVEVRDENWPRARMNAGLVICRGQLYLYGGLFEIGSKQITLSDLYSLDIRKMDKWKVLIPCDISKSEWFGSDSESSNDECESMSEDDDSETSSDSDVELN